MIDVCQSGNASCTWSDRHPGFRDSDDNRVATVRRIAVAGQPQNEAGSVNAGTKDGSGNVHDLVCPDLENAPSRTHHHDPADQAFLDGLFRHAIARIATTDVSHLQGTRERTRGLENLSAFLRLLDHRLFENTYLHASKIAHADAACCCYRQQWNRREPRDDSLPIDRHRAWVLEWRRRSRSESRQSSRFRSLKSSTLQVFPLPCSPQSSIVVVHRIRRLDNGMVMRQQSR